jgi:hypothetical protein
MWVAHAIDMQYDGEFDANWSGARKSNKTPTTFGHGMMNG